MEKSLRQVVHLLLMLGVVGLGNCLKCYSCAYVESGNLGLIDGFADVPQDSSCQWGGQPDDTFLIDCPSDKEPGFRYFQTCVFTRINGKVLAGGPDFNGTLWKCATRRQAIDPPDFQNTAKVFKEYKQGRLVDVTRNFRDMTGKEVLQNLTQIFDDVSTHTKFVSCDVDACVELEGRL